MQMTEESNPMLIAGFSLKDISVKNANKKKKKPNEPKREKLLKPQLPLL